MFKVINNKKDFIENPILEMDEEQISNSKTDKIVLFGKEYEMYADDWKHHVHIKCTDLCDSKCDFCIEKDSLNNPQNSANLLISVSELLNQLKQQKQLQTVSITGGEPTLFKNISSLISYINNNFDLKLFSINTNGRFLEKIPKNFNGWVNISKHAINDKKVFNRDFCVTKEIIKEFKKSHKNAKVRFQCVLNVTNGIDTIEKVNEFISEYKDVVDDFSFRNLILESDQSKVDSVFLELRNCLLNSGKFVEQVIQDYYVYEIYEFLGKSVTISWSNMAKLKEYNESHNDQHFLEEIIIHPDGTISGSWNKKSLIIYKPENTEDNTYLPCSGKKCDHHCKRYIGFEEENRKNELFDFLNDYSCGTCH